MKNTKTIYYFFIFLIFLFRCINTKAQIIYHPGGISGDCSTPFCVHTFDVQINNDTIIDLQVIVATDVNSANVVTSASSGSYISSDTTLLIGDTVNSSLAWTQSAINLRQCTGNLCHGWTNGSMHYKGIKLIVGGNTYYGWIQLNVGAICCPSYASFTITGWAYNSVPNQYILPGDTGNISNSIIETNSSHSFDLFPNPANNKLTIDLKVQHTRTELIITDISGRLVYSRTIAMQQTVIDLDHFSKGIYIVQNKFNESTLCRKILLVN